jgi:hypothetical protein
MKKFLFLALLFSAIFSTSMQAQEGADAATMLQRTKEKIMPQMIEKTGLTQAQAEKVIEINFEMRQTMMGYRNLNETDRAAKVAELKSARDKKYSDIPLTAEQIQAVQSFYQDMGKNMPQKSGN